MARKVLIESVVEGKAAEINLEEEKMEGFIIQYFKVEKEKVAERKWRKRK